MSAISMFFEDSLEYELNHQILICKFLKDPIFIKNLFGIDFKNPQVHWEYNKGLFDLAVGESEGIPILMIELKMWSGLSKSQLNKQTEFLKEIEGKGAYILLGTSDIEYLRNEARDDIALKSENLSQKIGYLQLIDGLKKYLDQLKNKSDLFNLISEYIIALNSQYSRINDGVYPKDKDQKHIYYYSIYQRIRDKYINEKLDLHIYTEHNRGGPSYILNDKGTWFEIEYEGGEFKLFQEILDGIHLIRLMGNNNNNVQRKLAQRISLMIQESELSPDNYDHSMRVSKYMKLARKKMEFKDPEDLSYEAELLLKTHKILDEISKRINAVINCESETGSVE